MEKLMIKKLSDTATIPQRATSGSAGFDLYADISQPIIMQPHQKIKIKTGIAIALPDRQTVGLVYARSGLSTKYGITLANCVGVIDSDYRGEIIVALINQSSNEYTISPQERIAQLVIAPIYSPELMVVDDLDDTSRGSGGFGSSGE